MSRREGSRVRTVTGLPPDARHLPERNEEAGAHDTDVAKEAGERG